MIKLFSFRLSTQFFVVTILLALILSLLASFLIKTIETKRLSENLRERSEQTLDFIAQSSIPAFESRNMSSLDLLSGQIMKGEEDICRVRIVLKDGTVIVDKIKPKDGERGQVLSVSRPVTGETGEIGNIAIYWELDRRLSEINKNSWLIVGYSFVAFFLAILTFLLVASLLVLKPIQRIEKQLARVASGKTYQPLKLSNFYGLELQHLSNAVNELHTRIMQQEDKEQKLIQVSYEVQSVKHQLVQAIEAVTEGFVYYNADDILTICNERYREIYPQSADLLVEGNSFEYIIRTGAERGQYEDARGRVEEWIQERLDLHENPKGPIEQRLPNGRWVRVIETRSVDGGLVGIRSDITEEKKYQKELKKAKEAAEQANKTKSQFLAMMSHEIRTPLNGVLGILGFLNASNLDEDQSKLVQTGQESATNLLTVINDILDYSKLEAGKVTLEITAFDPAAAFDSILDLLEPSAFAKGITLDLDKTLPDGLYLFGDASRLRQILLNFIGNAIKFTEVGGIKADISATQVMGDDYVLRFDVIDTGIGVDPEKQDLLFGEFVTVDASYTRKYGGTGLGLSICKKFVEMMHGDIGFKSEATQGSRFWFEVPLARAKSEDIPAKFEEDIEQTIVARDNARVLVVEDNAANQMVARKILENIGCRVDVAGNGIEAVDAVIHFPYDLILMDISMPEMDGLSATRKIRAMGGDAASIPIVAMTAHALKNEKEEFLNSGMDDYLQKPAPARKLHLIVDKWVNGKTGSDGKSKIPKSQNSLVDKDILADLLQETSADVFPDLVQCFEEDTLTRKRALVLIVQEKEADKLLEQVHSLGSSAATFGTVSLHDLCRKIETLLKEGEIKTAFEYAEHLEVTIDLSIENLTEFKDDLCLSETT